MKLSKFICIFSTLLLLNACSSKIEGEAFIVTKGGESKKLGLVEVQAFKISDIEEFKKKILNDYSIYIDKIEEDYKFAGLKEKHDDRNKLISEINEANKKYEKCRIGWFGKECDVKLPKDLADEFERRKAAIAIGTLAIIADKAVALDNKFDLVYLAGRLAGHTKSLESIKTKTDADGKFAMTLPSGEFLIVATGKRQSLGEDYFWLIRNNKGGNIRLANDSMFDQGCETCLFTKADIERLNDKKKKIDTFINGPGSLMISYAKDKNTQIYGGFWKTLCGKSFTYKNQKVFDWADCVE